MENHSVTAQHVSAAADRLSGRVARTPVVIHERQSEETGCTLGWKAENLQHTGSFKARGAMNAVMLLEPAEAARGVVTHSSGNHAAALARAAAVRGIQAHVVMPENSAANKIAAVRRYGVEPHFCAPDAASRAAMAEDIQRQTGAVMVHPYDDPGVIAGQGTVGVELLEQWSDVQTVVVPIGGGGLLSGVLTWLKARRPGIQVIAAEPQWADDAARGLQLGERLAPTRYDTIADGLRTPVGELTFPIIQSLLDDIITVSESAIVEATWRLLNDVRLVAEPSGAVTLAAVLSQSDRFRDRRVAMVISGGNLDFDRLPTND